MTHSGIGHDYAGFRYLMTRVGGYWHATPAPGQHPAANKEKHRRAAVETFEETLPPEGTSLADIFTGWPP